jgi:transcriptional regulator with XRE-family HTH domain
MLICDLLDRVRAKHGIRSEADLAEALGLPQARLTDYRTGRKPVDVDLAWTLAEKLKKPPAEVIAAVFFDSETDPVKKQRWRERLAFLEVLSP